MCGSLDAIKSLAKLDKGGKTENRKRALNKRKMLILKKQMYTTVFCMLGGLVLISMFFLHSSIVEGIFLKQSRNCYGTLGVSDTQNRAGQLVRELADGTTVHGSQFMTQSNGRYQPGTLNLGVALAWRPGFSNIPAR